MADWKPYNPHSNAGDMQYAEAGSDRIYYRRGDEVCYRHASWRVRGGVHGFWDGGPGRGVDPETLEDNGAVHPESEF
jgi:hypothetical protein